MTVDLNVPYSACELKRVKRVEFGVMDPEIIKKISVCEVVNVELYKDGLPKEGGLNDIRMGTIDYKLLCGTCNMTVKYCPGHFGHIKLAKPMYHYGFMPVVLNVLRCVCYHCGRLLCNRESPKVKYIEKIKVNSLRQRKLANLCSTIKTCSHGENVKEGTSGNEMLEFNESSGFASPDMHGNLSFKQGSSSGGSSALKKFYSNQTNVPRVYEHMLMNGMMDNPILDIASNDDVDCGCRQPKYTREGPNMFVQFPPDYEDEAVDESKRRLTAEEALEILKKIRKEDMAILGFDSDRCQPHSLILTYLPIPPPCARPYVQYGNQRSEDDLTLKLLDIIKTNIQLKNQTDRGAKSHVLQDLCSLLQFHITTLFDNDIPGMPIATTRSKKPIKAIRTRLKGKEGRLRGNLMGKRVDFSARTVITGDPNLGIEYIGVPKSVAMTLTFCETVTPLNYADLKKKVERGPYEWPGAKYIIRSNGTKYDLRHVRKNSEKELEYGYKVERHMCDDDYILFNRQPSLHKMSIMGHKAKILPYSTFRLNLSVTSPYNADFDGDEMNLHLAQSHETRSEIKHLMIVQNQIVSPQSNKPVMGIVQDSLLAIRKFTRRDNFLTREEVMSLLIWIPYWNHKMPTPAIVKPKPLWTGKQIFSMLLQFSDDGTESEEALGIQGMQGIEGNDMNGYVGGTTTGVGAGPSAMMSGVSNISSSISSPLMMNAEAISPISSLSPGEGINRTGGMSPGGVVNTAHTKLNKMQGRKIVTGRVLKRKVKINLIRDSSTPCKDDNPFCSSNDGKVIIKNNELLSGVICKRTVGSSSGSLIHILWHEMGPDKTKDFISALQKVTNNWLEYVGFTVSCSDIIASNKILNKVQDILSKSKKEVQKLVKKAQRGELECQPGKTLYESFETRVNNELNCAREMAGKVASESLDEKNNIYSMVVSGSKGSVINISQIISCVGQQNVEGKRIPFGFNQRSLPHFIKFDYGPESRGFVSNSYLSGLTPQEVFFHAMGGREGIIDTACKTSEIGYIQRRLIKAMEDIMVQYDRTVRNANGDIVQFLYGEDGMAGEYIEDQVLNLMQLDNKEIARLYKYNFDDPEDAGFKSDLHLCQNNDGNTAYMDYDRQNILNEEFNEIQKCKDYLCREIFPDGDIRQHLPINMNRLIEFAKVTFPIIPGVNPVGMKQHMRSVQRGGTGTAGRNIRNDAIHFKQDRTTNGYLGGTDLLEVQSEDNVSDVSIERREPHIGVDSDVLDPVEVVKKVNSFLDKLVIIKQINNRDTLSLEAQHNATILLKAHLKTYLNSKLLTRTHQIGRRGLHFLLSEVERNFYKCLCHPGECVGALAAQSIGEPATQMTLNTFHFAGVGSKNVTLGVPRLKELINIVKNVKTPSTTIYLDPLISNDQQKAKDVLNKLEYATLRQLTSHAQVVYDPDKTSTVLEEDQKWVKEFYEFPDEEDPQCTLGEWVLRIQLTNIQVNEKKLAMKEIVSIIYSVFSRDEMDIIYTDDNSEDLVLRIRVKYSSDANNSESDDILSKVGEAFTKLEPSMNEDGIERTDEKMEYVSGDLNYARVGGMSSMDGQNSKEDFKNNYDSLRNMQTTGLDGTVKRNPGGVSKEDTEDIFLKKLMEQCLSTLKLRGIENITKVYMREEPKIHYDVESGKFIRSSHWVLDTDGCNLENIFCAPNVDYKKTISNDIVEIFEVLGIEAARRALLKELRTVISFDSSYVNYRHLSILCDVMTQRGYLMSITRHGINRVDKGPLVKCSFEETVEILLEAAAFAQIDHLKGITENVMLGQLCKIGTGVFDIIIDSQKLNDANQNLEIIQDITSAGFTIPDTFQGRTPDGLQSPVPVNTLNSPLPFSPTYNTNLLSPTAPLDGIFGIMSPQALQNYPSYADGKITSPTRIDLNNLDTAKLGGKFSPLQSPHSPLSPTSPIQAPTSPTDHLKIQQKVGEQNRIFSPIGNMMDYNVFLPNRNTNTISNRNLPIQSPIPYSPNPASEIYSPKPQAGNNIYSPSYSPTSPSYNPGNMYYSPTSPNNQMDDYSNRNRNYNVMSPVYSVTSPKYSPTSPKYSPTSPKYSPTSPKYSPTSPQYSPTSPVAANHHIMSPQYSPYSITSPKFSPTSPAYSISSPVYVPNKADNRPMSPAFMIQSPTQNQTRQKSRDQGDGAGMSPMQNNLGEAANDDPFSPMPYNIEEDAEEEAE